MLLVGAGRAGRDRPQARGGSHGRNWQPFATVSYMVHLNDIASLNFPGFNPAGYEQQLTDEFG